MAHAETLVFLSVLFLQKAKHFADVFARGLHPKFGWYSGWDLLRRVYFVLVALWLPYVYISTRLVSASCKLGISSYTV